MVVPVTEESVTICDTVEAKEVHTVKTNCRRCETCIWEAFSIGDVMRQVAMSHTGKAHVREIQLSPPPLIITVCISCHHRSSEMERHICTTSTWMDVIPGADGTVSLVLCDTETVAAA